MRPLASQRRPPNILLIVTDQQRADTIAACGNPVIRTPALDRLVREGAVFNRAYCASPVCVSSRCALLTGLPPHASGCVDNQATPRHVDNLPKRLTAAGYQAHGVGKMHLFPDSYGKWGFESRDTSEEHIGDGDDYARFLVENGFDHVIDPHGVRSEYYYLPQPSQLPDRLHHTRWCADRSIDFLNRRDRDRPFFLMTSFIKPHPPFESPVPWNRLYRPLDVDPPDVQAGDDDLWTYWNRAQNRYKYTAAGRDRLLERTRIAAYYAAISYIDYQISRMFEVLGSEMDNTLVLFTSDHGEFLGDFGCHGKRSMLDPAARVPLLARWPGRIAPGRGVDSAASLIDIVPTALRAAGCADWSVHREGTDLVELSHSPRPDRTVYAQYQQGRFALYMAANATEKYVYSAADERAWWLLPGGANRLREADVTGSPSFSARFEMLERDLQDRFDRDGYTVAASGNSWVCYDPPKLPESPTAGLLVQDPGELVEAVEQLPEAYRREMPPNDYLLLGTPAPFKPAPPILTPIDIRSIDRDPAPAQQAATSQTGVA